MEIRISKRLSSLNASATLAMNTRAREMREQGIDVIAFAAGQPDFDTPQHIKDAAVEALAAGDTKYASPTIGRNALREAVRSYFRTYCGLEYALDQVEVAVGAKDLCHQAFAALLEPGDEAIIPVPYWISYPEQVRLAGGTPVFVQGNDGPAGKIGPAQLEAAITPRTRMLVLNSPSNPSGRVYSRAEFAALAAVLRRHDVIVLSDEIYHRLTVDGRPATSFAAIDGMADRTITVNGVSKTYAMTGWRLGFAGGPPQVITTMARLQEQTTSGAVSFVQAAAIAALTGDQSCVERMRRAYRERGDRMWRALRDIPGIRCDPPEGGFMLLADVADTFDRLGVSSGVEWAEAVLERAHVAVVPGDPFGCPGHVRFSFATDMESIEEGMRRLAKLLS